MELAASRKRAARQHPQAQQKESDPSRATRPTRNADLSRVGKDPKQHTTSPLPKQRETSDRIRAAHEGIHRQQPKCSNFRRLQVDWCLHGPGELDVRRYAASMDDTWE
ncbi:uncharacterized protein LOC144513043 [Sander vitreus]